MLKSSFVDEKGKLGTATRIGGNGGGGGGGSEDIFDVNFTESGGVYSEDKTYSDTLSAYNSGKKVAFFIGGEFVGFATLINSALWASAYAGTSGGGLLSFVSFDTLGVTVTQMNVDAAPTTVTVSGTTPTIAAADNTIYNCGELTSLTVSSFPATGKFWIWFTSGSTPTTVMGFDNTFVPEANKLYKVTVERGYGSYKSWPTT